MSATDELLSFLLAHSNAFFMVAIAAMFAGIFIGRKSLRAARVIAIVSLCASTPLLALYAFAAVMRPDLLTIMLAALWAWNVWSSWHTWRRMRPAKPVARDRIDRRN